MNTVINQQEFEYYNIYIIEKNKSFQDKNNNTMYQLYKNKPDVVLHFTIKQIFMVQLPSTGYKNY